MISSSFYDVDENVIPKQKHHHHIAERRNTIGAATLNITLNRNISIENFRPVNLNATPVIVMDNANGLNDHMKLDRSYSEPCDTTLNNNVNLNIQQKQPAVNSSRYKTELCRPFEEGGYCKYADKCQFAHGTHELKQLQRHPKYKTELCRTFHSKGFCPYGPRCNFIHNEDVSKLNVINDTNNHLTAQILHQLPSRQYFQNNFNSSYISSVGSSADNSPPSSVGSESPVFFGEDIHLVNAGYTLLNNRLNFDNSPYVCSDVSDLSLDLSPLNIQTHLTSTDMELITQQYRALVNLNNQRQIKNISPFNEYNSTHFTTTAAPSPDSISGENVSSSSASSFGSSNTFSCGSPIMESGKNFRLPVFNHISQD